MDTYPINIQNHIHKLYTKLNDGCTMMKIRLEDDVFFKLRQRELKRRETFKIKIEERRAIEEERWNKVRNLVYNWWEHITLEEREILCHDNNMLREMIWYDRYTDYWNNTYLKRLIKMYTLVCDPSLWEQYYSGEI